MNKTKTILISGMLAGILDAMAAIVLFAKPLNLHNASRIFRYIASGLFGKAAFGPGLLYPALGLILHFFIAVLWAAIYVYLIIGAFKPGSIIIKVALFASVIWIGMNGFVIPLSGLGAGKADGWATMRSFTVLLLCVSLPIVLIVQKKLR